MNSVFFAIFAHSIGAYKDVEYYNLTDEEKADLDYMDRCLYSDNEKINNASFYMMLFLIELSTHTDDYSYEGVQLKKKEIYQGLSKEEIEIMDRFIPACINSMGIYSEESKKERKLKKERIDK